MYNYYTDLKEFKSYYIQTCGVYNLYEARKIWTQWIIRNLSKNVVNDHLIPDPCGLSEDQLVPHLIEHGVSKRNALIFYQQVKSRVTQLYELYKDHKMAQNVAYELVNVNSQYTYEFHVGTVLISFPSAIYDKLTKLYNGSRQIHHSVFFELGYTYTILDGQSFQWSVPPKVLSLLEKTMDLHTELFASPMNVQLGSYYSLFSVDRFFGAIDNFFHGVPLGVTEGTYEVNPPFIEQTFNESTQLILRLLENNTKDLMFIYVMPDWIDCKAYQLLTKSRFLIDEIVLEAQRHCYYHEYTKKMICVGFSTHIILVGTAPSRARWTPQTKNQLIKHFTHC
jgi:hypothetical protein